MATCAITGTLQNPGGIAIASANIRFTIVTPKVITPIIAMPQEVSVQTGNDGTFSITLVQGISGALLIEYPPNEMDAIRRYSYSILVPVATTATLASLITEY